MQKSLILISAICLMLSCEETEEADTENMAASSVGGSNDFNENTSAGSSNSFTGNQSSNHSSNQAFHVEEVSTLSEFKSAFIELLVKHLDRCCSLSNELEARYTVNYSNGLQILYQPVLEGWATFDANQANICLNDVASAQIDCQDFSSTPFELFRSCQDVVIGQQMQGMSCGFFSSDGYSWSGAACSNGLECIELAPSNYTCQRPILEGSACISDDRCEKNLRCINGTCTRLAKEIVSCADVISSL